MKELGIGLVLAFFSGLTFLAYKRPKAYAQLHGLLIGLVIYAVSVALGTVVGGHIAFKALFPFVTPGKESEALQASEATALPIWGFLVIGLVGGYFIFLRTLPLILEDDEKDKGPKDPSG
jgi:hypothetical protein